MVQCIHVTTNSHPQCPDAAQSRLWRQSIILVLDQACPNSLSYVAFWVRVCVCLHYSLSNVPYHSHIRKKIWSKKFTCKKFNLERHFKTVHKRYSMDVPVKMALPATLVPRRPPQTNDMECNLLLHSRIDGWIDGWMWQHTCQNALMMSPNGPMESAKH